VYPSIGEVLETTFDIYKVLSITNSHTIFSRAPAILFVYHIDF